MAWVMRHKTKPSCRNYKKPAIAVLWWSTTGNALAHAGVIGGADMTVEATLTKLHYLLSQELDTETIRKAMSQNLRGELTPDD